MTKHTCLCCQCPCVCSWVANQQRQLAYEARIMKDVSSEFHFSSLQSSCSCVWGVVGAAGRGWGSRLTAVLAIPVHVLLQCKLALSAFHCAHSDMCLLLLRTALAMLAIDWCSGWFMVTDLLSFFSCIWRNQQLAATVCINNSPVQGRTAAPCIGL